MIRDCEGSFVGKNGRRTVAFHFSYTWLGSIFDGLESKEREIQAVESWRPQAVRRSRMKWDILIRKVWFRETSRIQIRNSNSRIQKSQV